MRTNFWMFRAWHWAIRTFFRLLYGPFAWTYDVVAWCVSLGQWNAWARVALDFLQGSRVLELGHGPGHLQVSLGESGHTAVGVDLSPQMGQLARRRVRRAGRPLRLVRARAQALPFRDGAFEHAVATFPTEYIVERATLEEVQRVLAANGTLVVVAAAHLTGSDLVTRFLEWLYRITGQREPLPNGKEATWADQRFTATSHWVPAVRSRVLVVTGKWKKQA
ncbi:MAG: methyltransferase domain-containing protein [Anaerolineae bacterium]|nr:methyltransferase domain-containing protein [Anaerolineae bacterium]